MSQVRVESETSVKSAPLLSVRGLHVVYNRPGMFTKSFVKAVDGISLDINPTEFITVVGESGSGKTTLGKCVMRLVKETEGSIDFDGNNISDIKGVDLREYRKKVQMVFQDPYESLNPLWDVYHTISIPIRMLVGDKDENSLKSKVRGLLENVGLDPSEVMYRFPHQLSGGQRQRVNIARALAPEPKLLVADEPITMLDAEQRLNILYLLKELQRKMKLTVLMITHDLASAKMTSNRVIIMYRGKIVETGLVNLVIPHPHHPYVELILSSAPRLDAKIEGIYSSSSEQQAVEEETQSASGCVFAARCKYATSVCSEKEPELKDLSPQHKAACYHPLNL